MLQQREEFVRLASQEDSRMSELCRRFGISRQTGYKWLERWRSGDQADLCDRSSRPRRSPSRTPAPAEEQVLELRARHPAWGARKIAHVLQRDRGLVLASSTVNSILRRHDCIQPAATQAATAWQRFEHEAPNELWQMDFKGHFATAAARCHPLTVIDDHSRFNLVLDALGTESLEAVQPCLQRTFERFGLPWRINTDNGPPWGASGYETVTRLGLWLIRLGIQLSYSAPAHPQTNGKDERFHRTFKAEVLTTRQFRDLADAQLNFDAWRRVYNCERPHQALSMQTPAQRYRSSVRPMPRTLAPIEYGPDDVVRRVQAGGWISVDGRAIRLSKALRGQPIALRRRPDNDGLMDVYFCHQRLCEVDLRQPC